MTRLDEMDLNEVSIKYESIFIKLIGEPTFNKILLKISNIYKEYILFINKKYKVKKGTFGRGELKWGRNIIWGWYIELLLKDLLIKNPNIKKIEFTGGDSSHKFNYNQIEKEISIEGTKTTIPDFLITLNNGKEFFLELKTAAVEVFTIKKTNVERLYKEVAYNGKLSLILMIDLENELFSLENLKYFHLLTPFENKRMEGQLCYNFPPPDRKIDNLLIETFEQYFDESIFSLDDIKKIKALKLAEDLGNKRLIKIIKNKISYEKKEKEKSIKINSINEQLEKIKEKNPEIDLGWSVIYKELGLD